MNDVITKYKIDLQFLHSDLDLKKGDPRHHHQGRDPLSRRSGQKYVEPRRRSMQAQMWKWVMLQRGLLPKGSFPLEAKLALRILWS